MPISYRNFVNAADAPQSPGAINPEHLADVGPRLPVQVAIPDNLAVALTGRGAPLPAPVDGYAVFDTGASVTCVDESILTGLGVSPTGSIDMSTPAGITKANTYACALHFPARPMPNADPIFVVGTQLQQMGYAVLIGRDFLSNMVLIYDGPGARITFAF